MKPTTFPLLFALLTTSTCLQPLTGRAQQHPHYHAHPHPTTSDAARFVTSRNSRVELPLPEETEAFTFAVFGDRTGGPPEGIEILKQAVADTNLFEPDLVMTVGDLIEGYNDDVSWLPQMREFKSEMNKLLCPWFPVAGNHDIYWRGEGRPKTHHEKQYEMYFGPLWYAFEHKDCWFIALFSDEGNPETGEKSFEVPELQKMSPEQFEWLKSVLAKAKDAQHVFVFLHHPRWLGRNYGDDWQRVHRELVAAGNVRAVFAGHIHHMRYDGPRDGIEYVTLATVGGGQSELSYDAGWLHHYNIVTVRPQQIAMACIPVGEVMDVREVTGTVSEDIGRIARTPPSFPSRPVMQEDGTSLSPTVVELINPGSQPVEFEVSLDPVDRHWISRPDHFHRKVYPGQKASFPLKLRMLDNGEPHTYQAPQLLVHADYLTSKARFTLRERRFAVPVKFQLPKPEAPSEELAARVGEDQYLTIADSEFELTDGPLTLECWCKADSFAQRVGLVTKTQASEYGLFVSGGIPYFTVHLDGKYVQPNDLDKTLQVGQWHHVAGVYDGQEVRTYLDGKLVAQGPGSGKRTKNRLPLVIGADVTPAAEATSPFNGLIDGVRLSKVARYSGEEFAPTRRFSSDESTVVLLNFDKFYGPLAYDESQSMAHARRHGEVKLVPAE